MTSFEIMVVILGVQQFFFFFPLVSAGFTLRTVLYEFVYFLVFWHRFLSLGALVLKLGRCAPQCKGRS